MKARELHEMTDKELQEQLTSIKAELFNLRFQQATGQLENPMRIKEIKKDYARVKTILHQRELKAVDA
ncbi:MAG: 50S ribosomal protein L29 [Eubacteriaceae bacterium]|jgi:large subunit ribosomal protein L29|nr:50S ribosomal protein L29 [Eubacteriaceae bacterium]